MAEWQKRAQINGDVVFFPYANEGVEKNSEEVFIWDLDKTYLDTSIDSLRGLMQTILERAFSKRNIPGTNTLLLALNEYRKLHKGQVYFPIYFITASPPQMEERISEKLALDRINPLGCFYKDNLRNLKPGRFWRLTKQVGYKLQALMQLRTRLHPEVHQICWGDDSESDAIIYNLYSDICARRLSTNEIRRVLSALNVTGDQVDTILLLQSQVNSFDPVEKVYINLATDTDPDYYLKFGRRTLATYNTFQVALDLVQDHRLGLEGLFSVLEDMRAQYFYTNEELAQSLDELVRRGVLGQTGFQLISEFLMGKGFLPSDFKASVAPQKEKEVANGRVFSLEGGHEPWVPEHVDYLNDYR